MNRQISKKSKRGRSSNRKGRNIRSASVVPSEDDTEGSEPKNSRDDSDSEPSRKRRRITTSPSEVDDDNTSSSNENMLHGSSRISNSPAQRSHGESSFLARQPFGDFASSGNGATFTPILSVDYTPYIPLGPAAATPHISGTHIDFHSTTPAHLASQEPMYSAMNTMGQGSLTPSMKDYTLSADFIDFVMCNGSTTSAAPSTQTYNFGLPTVNN